MSQRAVLMVSSYPYEKCGVSTYTGHLLQELRKDGDASTFTIKLIKDGPIKYLAKSIHLTFLLLTLRNRIVHFQYTPTIMGPFFPLFLMLGRMGRNTLVTTVHENMRIYADNRSALLRWLLFAYERRVLALSDAVVVMSSFQENDLLAIHKTSVKVRFSIIPLGIDAFKVKANAADSDSVIGAFGFVKPGKGLEYLAEASKKVLLSPGANRRLIIAGSAADPDYLKKLHSLFASVDAHALWLGYLPDGEMKELMASCACIVLFYEKSTNSAILMDAISAQVPVVVSNVGSFAENVTSWGVGVVAEARNSDALAETLEALLGDKSSRLQMIKNEAAIKAKYSWPNISGMHHELYEAL